MFFKEAVNNDDMFEFQKALMRGKISKLQLMLQKHPEIINVRKPGFLPSVTAALYLSSEHASDTLDLLAQHGANFNTTCYLETVSEINYELNPLAWFLLRGGDYRLIDKLLEHGTDPNHPSVEKISTLIRKNTSDPNFNYITDKSTTAYCPRQLCQHLAIEHDSLNSMKR